MKFLDEYRDPDPVRRLRHSIAETVTQPWTLMEVCGGQTHAILKFGLDQLLPQEVSLIHGPGCPVCVTPIGLIDKAVEVALRPGVVLCSFGDMLRVPGSRSDLFRARARGADVRVVYSPLDALRIARCEPRRQVVFFAVGFETTAPANAMAVYQARQTGVDNFSLLVSHVLVPPAIEVILGSPSNRVQAFLAAGHVCTIMGIEEYRPLAARYGVPIVVTGFEPVDLLRGVLMAVRQLEQGRAEVENAYTRVVRRNGNDAARQMIREVFRVVQREWRGIGVIGGSGLGLAAGYRQFDAERRFDLAESDGRDPSECMAGEVLTGVKRPHECPQFGARCTPERPLGAPMVSSEGACAAYYRYRAHARPGR